MAHKAVAPFIPPAGDEVFAEAPGISLCLMIDRRARAMRIVDFRSGPNPAKRVLVDRVAEREGIDRIYTVVERDEASSWTRLGLQREGSIGSFYKRSDAFVLGALVPAEQGEEGQPSGTRLALANAPASRSAESVYQAGRRLARAASPSGAVKVQQTREDEFQKLVAAALRRGSTLTEFNRFGRDVERWNFTCTARGGFCLLASVETQPCFSNAFLELLTSPKGEKEAQLTVLAVHQLCEQLLAREIVGCFALSPVNSPELAGAYIANGFRRTGQLAGHFLLSGQRIDAFLWSRKLAQPSSG